MHLLTMLLIGLLVGSVARLLTPGRPGGVVMTVLVGLGGSLVAGFIGRALGWYQSPLSTPGIIASIAGAMLLLAVFGMVAPRRASHSS